MTGYRFDWYQATVQDSAQGVASWGKQVWPDGIMRPCKARNGAAEAFQMCLGDLVVFTAMWGGGMEGSGVNLWASGCDAEFFAEQLRRRWGVHRVTRADVAIDFDGAGAWDWASKLLLDLADKHSLVVDHQGDFHRAQLGRSIYIGSKTSPVRAVVYEKGKQIPELGMPDLVRIELRVRPKGREAGLLVCQMRPEAMYGAAKWAGELGAFLQSETKLERVTIGTRWTKSDRARAIAALVSQYGAKLGELCGELGGWEEVGLHIGQMIVQAAEQKNRLIEDTAKIRRGESILPTKAQVPELTN